MGSIIRRFSFALAVLPFVLTGCSDNNAAHLSGQIRLNGVPIENGSIRFTPTDGKGPTAEVFIENGKYVVTTAPGPRRVEIRDRKVVGSRHLHKEDPSTPMVDVVEVTVPARYNTASELTTNLESGSKTQDFELESTTK
jgi:hypothetical protein